MENNNEQSSFQDFLNDAWNDFSFQEEFKSWVFDNAKEGKDNIPGIEYIPDEYVESGVDSIFNEESNISTFENNVSFENFIEFTIIKWFEDLGKEGKPDYIPDEWIEQGTEELYANIKNKIIEDEIKTDEPQTIETPEDLPNGPGDIDTDGFVHTPYATIDGDNSGIQYSADGSIAVVRYQNEEGLPVVEYYEVKDGEISSGPLDPNSSDLQEILENGMQPEETQNTGAGGRSAGLDNAPGEADEAYNPNAPFEETSAETSSQEKPATETPVEDPRTTFGQDDIDQAAQAAINSSLNQLTSRIIDDQNFSEDQAAVLNTSATVINQNIAEMYNEGAGAWDDIGTDAAGAGISAITSLAMSEYYEHNNTASEALGIEDAFTSGLVETTVAYTVVYGATAAAEAAGYVSTAAQTAQTGEAANAAANGGFVSGLKCSVAGYAGSYMAGEIRSDIESEEEAIGMAVGSAVGSAVMSWAGPGGVFFGSMIGGIIGGEIGEEYNNLVNGDKVPEAWATYRFNPETESYELVECRQHDGGNKDLVKNIGSSLTAQIDTLITAQGGQLADPYTMPDITVRHEKGKIWVNGHQGKAGNIEELMLDTIKENISSFATEGGSPNMARAILETDAESFGELYTDIGEVAIYDNYQKGLIEVTDPQTGETGLMDYKAYVDNKLAAIDPEASTAYFSKKAALEAEITELQASKGEAEDLIETMGINQAIVQKEAEYEAFVDAGADFELAAQMERGITSDERFDFESPHYSDDVTRLNAYINAYGENISVGRLENSPAIPRTSRLAFTPGNLRRISRACLKRALDQNLSEMNIDQKRKVA